MKITVGYDPSGPRALAFAASELRSYLERMLPEEGTWRAEAAVAGEAPARPDTFAVKLTPEGGRITGNSGRAVLLGVYDLLRRLGCRFLAPGKGNETVPVIRREDLSLEYEHEAFFRHRGVCIEGANSRENVLDFIDWLPKVGYNSFFFQFKVPYTFYARWYHHEKNPLKGPESFTVADAAALTGEAEDEIRRRGLLLHRMGHGWTGEVLGYETVAWQPDGRPLAPELAGRAALINGKRGLFQGIPADTNLCYHSGEAVDAFAALVTGYAKSHRDVDYLHIWLADEYNNVCECDGCRQTTLSDQYVELLNEIDRRLTAEGLNTRLVFLLYQELLWPPVRARLENPGRFVLMFAPISRTFERSYQLGEAGTIPPYRRNRITLPTSLSENLAFLRAWQEQFTGDSFVYDYPLGRAHYGDFGYVGISRVIRGDIAQLRRMGLNGYISCQELRAALPNALPNYVMGRALMDESLGAEKLIAEYFAAAYGGDWERVREYLETLSRLSSPDYINGKGERTDPAMAGRMAEIRTICKGFSPVTAAHRSDAGEWDSPFWGALEYHRSYVLHLAKAVEELARGEENQALKSWKALQHFICENEPDHQSLLDAYRVLEVTGKYTGFDRIRAGKS